MKGSAGSGPREGGGPGSLPLVARAAAHPERTAVVAPEGTFTYGGLLAASHRGASGLLAGRADLGEARVAFLVPPGFAYPAVQWGIWRAGGIAVPLALSHPRPELEHTLDDAGASLLVASPSLADRLRPLARERRLRLVETTSLLASSPGPLPRVLPQRRAMIVYTSGTTGRPKGAVTTHANLQAQVESLVAAWGWREDDRILAVLPLHHVHGIVNVLLSALWSGAVWEVVPQPGAEEIWRRIEESRPTLFMAVPTIYHRLLDAWQREPPERRRALSRAASGLRLMVSGSAALPVVVLERWREATGHTLLERYGMTEIGMALSNPLVGERRPGTVGRPLPGVEVRRADEAGRILGAGEDALPGELEVRGPGVFREYWDRPEATREAFRPGGWFRTGDVAVIEGGAYRLLGRQSVDILKTGGYKISALEIEEVLRTHPAVRDCAVVGVPDPEWGERVAAAVVLAPGGHLELEALRTWAKERLAPYKVPTLLRTLEELPRNALGKVTKPRLVEEFAADG